MTEWLCCLFFGPTFVTFVCTSGKIPSSTRTSSCRGWIGRLFVRNHVSHRIRSTRAVRWYAIRANPKNNLLEFAPTHHSQDALYTKPLNQPNTANVRAAPYPRPYRPPAIAREEQSSSLKTNGHCVHLLPQNCHTRNTFALRGPIHAVNLFTNVVKD